MTLFYETVGFVSAVFLTLAEVLGENTSGTHIVIPVARFLPPSGFSYAMFLMMDHNERHYKQFLRMVYYTRLHWICCKWEYMVIAQLMSEITKLSEDKDAKMENTIDQNITEIAVTNIRGLD